MYFIVGALGAFDFLHSFVITYSRGMIREAKKGAYINVGHHYYGTRAFKPGMDCYCSKLAYRQFCQHRWFVYIQCICVSFCIDDTRCFPLGIKKKLASLLTKFSSSRPPKHLFYLDVSGGLSTFCN